MEVTGLETYIIDNETGVTTLQTETGQLSVDITSVLVRLQTDEGIVGLGESFHHSDTAADSEALVASIEALGERLVGEDPRNVRAHWHDLYTTVKRSGAYEALSVLDQAMWDVTGKAVGEPVYRLLGGPVGELDAYATFPVSKPADELVEDAQWLADAGFAAMKIVAGFGVEQDRKRIRTVAEQLPEGFGLAIDANTAYEYTDALRVARTAAEHDLLWFEEPVAHTDYEGLAELRRQTGVPIAGYQTHATHYPAVDHLRANALDVYQPSTYHAGGVTFGTNLAAVVEAFNKRLVPHAVGPATNYAASLHVAAASSACSLVEFAVFDDDIDDPRRFIASPYVANQDALSVAEDGTVAPPDEPGLGVELDLDYLEANAKRVER